MLQRKSGALTIPHPLDGKTALVTGASRGIGRAIARRLAHHGAFVIVHFNTAEADAASVVQAITATGGQAAAARADLATPAGATLLADAALALLNGRNLDILVNNAGISRRAEIQDVTPEQFAQTLQVNLQSPFFLIQRLLPHLNQGGRIVNVSSIGTRTAYPAMASYAPSKAGLEALTLLLAPQLGPRGITVNAVRPGATATDMNAGARDPATAAATATTIALGRVGQAEDIAKVVAFLASPDSGWITGQCLDASGGQRL